MTMLGNIVIARECPRWDPLPVGAIKFAIKHLLSPINRNGDSGNLALWLFWLFSIKDLFRGLRAIHGIKVTYAMTSKYCKDIPLLLLYQILFRVLCLFLPHRLTSWHLFLPSSLKLTFFLTHFIILDPPGFTQFIFLQSPSVGREYRLIIIIGT